jgi:hypothetical protein
VVDLRFANGEAKERNGDPTERWGSQNP